MTSTGDTINKKDSLGYWQGRHVEMRSWGCNKLNDTCSYQIGYFKNGQPIGNWTDHKKDKSFSIGHYNSGIEVTSDGKGGWTEKHQGIYAKIGVWQYFDKDSNLLKTERYDRSFSHNCWTDKYYLQDTTGNFILTKYEFKNGQDLHSRFNKHLTKYFTDKGIPISYDIQSFWKDLSYEYNQKGQIKKIIKHRKFLGKKLKTTIKEEYNDKGQVICKTKTKCKHPPTPRMTAHFI